MPDGGQSRLRRTKPSVGNLQVPYRFGLVNVRALTRRSNEIKLNGNWGRVIVVISVNRKGEQVGRPYKHERNCQ
jgi:hypothetical protein